MSFASWLIDLIRGPRPSPPRPPSPPPKWPPSPPIGTPPLAAKNLDPVNARRFMSRGQAVLWDAQLQRVSEANDAQELIHHAAGHWSVPVGADYAWGQCAVVGVYSPAQAVEAWMNSPRHKAILLRPDFTVGALAIDLRSGVATATLATPAARDRGVFVRPDLTR